MKKTLFLAFFTFYSSIFGQATKIITVLDTETNMVIPKARILWNENIFYTNDDGKVTIPSEAKNILITSASYQEFKIENPQEIIKLTPKYTDIQEVVIENIDIKSVFEDVIKNYNKYYGTPPTIFNIQLKQKAKEENKLNNLFVADLKLWLLDSQYHFKNKLTNFIQISIEKIRYFQTRKTDPNYIFGNDINIIPEQFAQKIFLNAELSGILNDTKNYKIHASIISEDENIKAIKFKSDRIEKFGFDFTGEAVLNKSDNAITYLKIDVNQSNTFSDKKNKRGEKYKTKTTFVSLIYEFYKNGEKYIPTRHEVTGKGFLIYKDITSPFDFFQEIIYKSSEQESKKGLSNKIDLSQNLTDNIPINEIKDTKTLLSAEEQKFVDEP